MSPDGDTIIKTEYSGGDDSLEGTYGKEFNDYFTCLYQMNNNVLESTLQICLRSISPHCINSVIYYFFSVEPSSIPTKTLK